MKTNLLLILWILSAFGLCGSCNNGNTINSCIQDFRITAPAEPNCPSLTFILMTPYVEKIKAIYTTPNEILNIEVNGSFFDKPDFYHGDWRLPLLSGDSIIMSSRSCYFGNKSQEQLDSIALYSIDNLSIKIIFKNDTLLFFKCKDSIKIFNHNKP
jgi:hypothetical protein